MATGFKPTGVAIVELCAHSGAFDGFVQQGTDLVESTLLISDNEAEKLARVIGTLVGEYRKSGRMSPEICIGFEGGTLLIVWGDSGGVTLRFRKGVDRIESVVAECRTFLKQVLSDAAPAPIVTAVEEPVFKKPPADGAWVRYEPRLVNLLSGVISRSQASRIIQRVLVSMELSDPVPDDMLENITREVLEKIPDRRRRMAIAAEARDELELILNN
jgi:hypothetical protein